MIDERLRTCTCAACTIRGLGIRMYVVSISWRSLSLDLHIHRSFYSSYPLILV